MLFQFLNQKYKSLVTLTPAILVWKQFSPSCTLHNSSGLLEYINRLITSNLSILLKWRIDWRKQHRCQIFFPIASKNRTKRIILKQSSTLYKFTYCFSVEMPFLSYFGQIKCVLMNCFIFNNLTSSLKTFMWKYCYEYLCTAFQQNKFKKRFRENIKRLHSFLSS